MRLAGTEVMTLRDAAARFCTRELPPRLFALERPTPAQNLQQRVTQALQQRLDELHEIRQNALETKEVLEKLATLVDAPAEFNRLVGRVDQLRGRVQRHDRIYNLISQVSQGAELRRLHADRAIRDDRRETPQTARRRLARDRDYVTAFIDGCDFLLQMLPEAMQRARERLR